MVGIIMLILVSLPLCCGVLKQYGKVRSNFFVRVSRLLLRLLLNTAGIMLRKFPCKSENKRLANVTAL